MSKRIILSNVDKPELPSIPVIEEVKEIRFTNDMELVTSVADSDCFMIELGVDPQGHPRVVNFASIIESLTGDMEPGSNKFITGDLLFKIVGDVDSLETMLKDNLVTAINYVNFANKQTQKALDDEIERSTRKDDEHDSLIASNRQDININATRIAQEVDRATREEAKIRQEIDDYKDYQSGVDNAQDIALRQETESRILSDQGIRDDMEAMDEEHDSRLKELEKLSHEQNTDTGTSSQTFQLQTKSGGVKIKNEDGTFSVRNGADTAYANATLKDLLVKGNLVVEGESTIIKAQTVEVADNLLLLNDGETGAGVTKGMSGIAVDRGTLADYMFVFDESDGAFKIGEENSLQIVATRGTEGEMTNGFFTSWNSSTLKLETTNRVPSGLPLRFGKYEDGGAYGLLHDEESNSFFLTYRGEVNNNTPNLRINLGDSTTSVKVMSTKNFFELYPALKLMNSSLHVPAGTFYVHGNNVEIFRITPDLGVTSNSFFRKKDNSEVLYHADIVNNVTSGGDDKVLSAEQGKSLKELIDSVDEDLSSNYLPLYGGVMKGSIGLPNTNMDNLAGILNQDRTECLLAYALRSDGNYWSIIASKNTGTLIRSNNTDLIHGIFYNGSTTYYNIWDTRNLPHPAELDKDNVFTGSVTANILQSEEVIVAKKGVQVGTTTDCGWYPDGVRIAAGISNARGVNVRNLLVSSSWSDYTKVPTNGAYIKGKAIVDTLEISRSTDDDVAQITFSKAGKNYICAPEGGSFAFVPDGKESSAYQLLIEGNKITMGQASSNTSMEVNGTIDSSGLIKARNGIQVGTVNDCGWYLGGSGRIVAGMNTVRNISVGSLLVSDNYTEHAKVPTNGIYSKGSIVSGGPVVSNMGMRIGNNYTLTALNSTGVEKRLIGKADNNTTYVGDIDGSMALYTAESDLIHHRNGSNYTILDSYNYQRFITVPKWTYGFVGMSVSGGQTVDLNTALEGDSNPKAVYNYNGGYSWVNGPSGMNFGSVIRFLCSSATSGSLFPQLAFDISAHDVTEKSTGKFWFRTPNNKGLAAANWKRVLTESDTLINLPGASRIASSESNLFLGNSSNNGWVRVQDIASATSLVNWYIKISGESLFRVNVKSNVFTDIDGIQSLVFNTNGANFIKPGGVVNVSAGGLITATNYDDIAYLPASGIYSKGVIRTNEYYLAGRANNTTNGQWGYGFYYNSINPVHGLGTLYSSGEPVLYKHVLPKMGSAGWQAALTGTYTPTALHVGAGYLSLMTASSKAYTEGETVTMSEYKLLNYESDGSTFEFLGDVRLKNEKSILGYLNDGVVGNAINLIKINTNNTVIVGSQGASGLYLTTLDVDVTHNRNGSFYKMWDTYNLPQPLYMNYSNPYFINDININVPNAGGAGWARALVWRTNTTETQAALGATGSGSSVSYAYLGVATGKLYNSTNQLRVYENKVTFNGKNLLTEADVNLDSYLPLSAGSSKALTGTLFAPYGINIKNDVGLKFGIDANNSNYLAALYSYNGVLKFGANWTNIELGSENNSYKINVLSPTIFSYGKRYNGYSSAICTDVYSHGTQGTGVAGTMAITISNKGNNTMCIFEIDIYNYVNNSHSRYIISGYLYNSNQWIANGVTRTGTSVGKVRLAYDSNGNPVILIGTTSSMWNHPVVYINKALVSYGGRNANWQSGYSISYLTDETGLSVKSTPKINGDGIKSDAGFVSVVRSSNINYEKKGSDLLHISSFVTGATGAPGVDSISNLQVNDGVALTYFWSFGGDLAFQLACDIDGTGMAYRYYTPSTGNTVRGWNFLATTGWVNDTFAKKTDVGDLLTKTTADGYYASKSIYTTTSGASTSGYPVISSLGNELVVYNRAATAAGGSFSVNYRTMTGKYAPRDWYWRAGSGTDSFANGYWGNLYMNNSIVATREWVEGKGYMTSTSIASTYLPLSGGTLTGKLTIIQNEDAKLIMRSSDADNFSLIEFQNSSGNTLGKMGYTGNKYSTYHDSSSYEIWDKYNLNNPATQEWVKSQGYLTSSEPYTLPQATASALGGVKIGATGLATKNYAIQLNSSGQMYVAVPWTDTNTTYSVATTSASGLMSAAMVTKLNGIAAGANNYSLPIASSSNLGGVKGGYTTQGKNYAVSINSAGEMYVNVPWTDNNTTYSVATASVAGLVKPVSVITKPTIQSVTTTSGRYYNVQMSSDGNMFVNVPWSNTTYSAATATVLGLVKVGNNITNTSGLISLDNSNVVSALGFYPVKCSSHSGQVDIRIVSTLPDNQASNTLYFKLKS